MYNCNEFKNLETVKRIEKVKEKKLCFICLHGHKIGECKSKYRCQTCGKKHNTLLHLDKKNAPIESKNAMCTTAQTNDSESDDDSAKSISALVVAKASSSVLSTAMVRMVTRSGEKIFLRALIDNCAQSAFISEQAVQLLKLHKANVSASITGIG